MQLHPLVSRGKLCWWLAQRTVPALTLPFSRSIRVATSKSTEAVFHTIPPKRIALCLLIRPLPHACGGVAMFWRMPQDLGWPPRWLLSFKSSLSFERKTISRSPSGEVPRQRLCGSVSCKHMVELSLAEVFLQDRAAQTQVLSFWSRCNSARTNFVASELPARLIKRVLPSMAWGCTKSQKVSLAKAGARAVCTTYRERHIGGRWSLLLMLRAARGGVTSSRCLLFGGPRSVKPQANFM